jgi:TolB-like protein
MTQLRLAVFAMIAIAGSVGAQCADGSPPPCRTQAVASAARRVDPPLDDKTWIVVPFDNLNNSQDVDWLRAGSVNLLYLGMSRWTDLRVIDDERVADYMRELPGGSGGGNVSLNTGLAVAKRAGARNLVMGDLLKLGSRTTVNAKIYDVRTGQRVRSVREETTIADSLMAMYGKLSSKVLNIAPPAGSASGVVGTTSTAAYQSYSQGMQAMNRFDMPAAESHFNQALKFDSSFALAHAKLAILIGWTNAGSPDILRHSQAASRLSGQLPPRERMLIDASLAFATRDFVKACDGFRGLVQRDSTDTDAWYGLGDCLFHDPAVEPVPGDTSRFRFRSSRNASLRAFRTALNLDRSYHLAYQHIVDAYLAPQIGGQWCVESRCIGLTAVLRPSGDSLLLEPLRNVADSSRLRQHQEEAVRTRARPVMYESARLIGSQWLAASPTERRAQLMFGAALLASGRVDSADIIMRLPASSRDSSSSGYSESFARLEIAMKKWNAAETRRLYDSTMANPSIIPGSGGVTTARLAMLAAPMLGRLADYDSLISMGMRAGNVPASRVRVSVEAVRVQVGLPAELVMASAKTVFDEVAATRAGTLGATRAVAPIYSLSLKTSVDQWPAFDTTVKDLRALPAIAAYKRDTAAMRRAAVALDSVSLVFKNALIADTAIALLASEAYLSLKDSLKALQMTRRWLDTSLMHQPILVGSTGNSTAQVVMPRMVLQRAELAAALGFKAEATLWFDRLLAFWSNPDPALLPLVERAKATRARLNSP